MEILDNLKRERQSLHIESLDLIQNIVDTIQKKRNDLRGQNKNTIFVKNAEKRLNLYEEQTNKIKKALSSTLSKYKIVFIGSIGVGKTTSICYLFRLLDKDKTLLSTGSGRTTICAVEIKSGKNTSIEIEGRDKKEIEIMIEQFLSSFTEERAQPFPEESARLIRNFIGKPKTTKKESKQDEKLNRKIYKTIIVDELKNESQLIKSNKDKSEEEKNNEIKKWIDDYIKKADLDQRTESILTYNGQKDEKDWLKEEFNNINNGLNPKFTYPKKISLILSEEEYNLLSYFDSIVDSKGLDKEDIARKDIDDIIKDESEHTIVLFMTGFKDAPEERIRQLIQNYLLQESNFYHQRFGILVLPRGDEPEKENGADGDWGNGIALKRTIIQNEIIQKTKDDLSSKTFPFKEDNIIFYDALKESKEMDYREDTLFQIYNIIYTKEMDLKDELLKILKSIPSIESIDENTLKILNHAKLNIQESSINGINHTTYIDELIQIFLSNYPHWKTRKAIADRDGIFGDKNVYFAVKYYTEYYLRIKTDYIHNTICGYFDKIIDLNLRDQIKSQLKSHYDKFIKETAEKIESKFNDIADEEFWEKLQVGPFGQQRFRDVVSHLLYNLDGEVQTFNQVIRSYSSAFWKREYINPILLFIQTDE